MDPRKDVVRRGYDALSYLHRGHDEEPEHYATWVAQLQERVPTGGAVLDIGCGCGVPLARDLVASGDAVTGVDLSAVQIRRARQLVPTARFHHADATQLRFPSSTFDAVVACTRSSTYRWMSKQRCSTGRPLASTRRVAPGHHRAGRLDRE